ncbi:hypothetical protein FEM48_Zijuj04G0152800 [Ziziphus jujuba var. spinosa]|uniref:Uncharacterized protein n=1 Tax=Ziziphus jujuba var. spinosa TaxID=714518 RepID=A0A978VKL8_ZIZJJ|nr:hypothetical protein FEM48_Zijuj04G0152800 [Ziziphus jujuba var. spinosa]
MAYGFLKVGISQTMLWLKGRQYMDTKTNMEEEEAGGVLRRRSRREVASEECIPSLLCIFSAICYAGFNIISKVYLDKGMSVYVLVAYGHAFETLTTAFLAFLFERYLFSL